MSTTNPAPAQAAATTVVPLAPGATPAVTLHAVELPSNGVVRIRLRPNGDPAGDSHAIFYVKTDTTAADIQAWVAQEKARVAAEYAAMLLAQGTLLDAIPLG